MKLNENLMDVAKEWKPHMGWMPMWFGMGPWKGHGMMSGKLRWGIPWSMGYGLESACGESMVKPDKEQVLELLESRKERLEKVLEHINMEISKLKETKEEEKPQT